MLAIITRPSTAHACWCGPAVASVFVSYLIEGLVYVLLGSSLVLNTGFILHLSFSKSCGVHDSATRYTLIYSLYGILYFHWHTRLKGQTASPPKDTGNAVTEVPKRSAARAAFEHRMTRSRVLRATLPHPPWHSFVSCSKTHTIKNGVLQGPVLAPMLFNIKNMYDIPKTSSTKYI